MLSILALILSSLILVYGGKDYYKILSVSKTASTADIKRAYRKLSLKYHPDKNPAPDAADKFAEISVAYDVLSDPDKREAYNRGGEEAVKMQEQRENTPQQDPFSIFEAFGFGGFGGQRRHEDPRTPNVEIPVRLTLKQLYLGEIMDVEYVRQVMCVEANLCQKKNQDCAGPGVKIRVQQLAPGFMQQVQVSDPSCVARGKSWKTNCKACPNGMTEQEEIQLTLDIQAGMTNGDSIRFEQIADEAVGHIAGDLIFVIEQIPDTHFERRGDDLNVTMDINLLESLVGFKRSFEHFDGHLVNIDKTDVTYCSQQIEVKGEGMPKKKSKKADAKGDLYVTFNIVFPEQLSEEQKGLVTQAFAVAS